MADRDPFQSFSASKYLQEYYGVLGDENLFLMEFLHETYGIHPAEIICDIGSGPTIYQLISASRSAHSIHVLEYLDTNRKAVQSWLNKEEGAFHWNDYFEFAARQEGLSANEIENRTRKSIQSIARVDLFQPVDYSMLPEIPSAISSHFCVESITSNAERFDFAWNNLMGLVPAGGLLVMSLLKNARHYRAGEDMFPAFPVDEEMVRSRLTSAGFENIFIRSIAAEDQRDYEGLICVRATR